MKNGWRPAECQINAIDGSWNNNLINVDKLNDYVITIDIDWASDDIIAEVTKFLIAHQVKATWFATHDSQEIKRLFDYPDLFEIGHHPNFSEGSSQGKTHEEIMNYLQKIAPYAKSMRTHGLVQSSQMLKMVREEFNIIYDVSLLLPNTPNIAPHEIFFTKGIGLIRFPYFWEDDIEMFKPNPCFSLVCNRYHPRGLKIFDFHPIHIVLNSSDMNNYYSCKRQINISKCSLLDLQPYINTGYGTGTFFKELVKFISSTSNEDSLLSGKTISQLALEWGNLK